MFTPWAYIPMQADPF